MMVVMGEEKIFFTWPLYGAIFWVCAEYSDDNRGFFLLLLRGVYMGPRPFLLFVLLHWGRDWEYLGGWEETQPGQVTHTGPRDVPENVTSYPVYKLRERRWGMSDVIYLP